MKHLRQAVRRRGSGVAPSEPVCFGAIGFPIAINSETVTNLNPFVLQLVKCRRHRLDRPRMDVVGENDGARTRFPHDAACYDGRARPFPVERIHVPKDDAITKFSVDPLFLPRRDRAVGRPHQDRVSRRSPSRIASSVFCSSVRTLSSRIFSKAGCDQLWLPIS